MLFPHTNRNTDLGDDAEFLEVWLILIIFKILNTDTNILQLRTENMILKPRYVPVSNVHAAISWLMVLSRYRKITSHHDCPGLDFIH